MRLYDGDDFGAGTYRTPSGWAGAISRRHRSFGGTLIASLIWRRYFRTEETAVSETKRALDRFRSVDR